MIHLKAIRLQFLALTDADKHPLQTDAFRMGPAIPLVVAEQWPNENISEANAPIKTTDY